MPYKVNFEIIEMEHGDFHTIVKPVVEGRKIRAVLDTGASHSCIDKNFIKSVLPDKDMEQNEGVNAGIGGSDFEVLATEIEDFRIGHYRQNETLTIAVIDFIHINSAYEILNIKPIQMILGNDFLVKHKAIIDYSSKKLFFNK